MNFGSSPKPEVDSTGRIAVSMDIDDALVDECPETSWMMRICLPLRLMFVWVFPHFLRGCFRPPTMQDLPKLPPSHTPSALTKRFERVWNRMRRRRCGLLLSLLWTFGRTYVLSACLQLVATASWVATPKVMEKFLKVLVAPERTSDLEDAVGLSNLILPSSLRPGAVSNLGLRSNDWEAWLWGLVLVLVQVCSSVCLQWGLHLATRLGVGAKSILQWMIYRKTLRLSTRSRGKFDSGHVVNLSQSDCQKVFVGFMMFNYGWPSLPMMIVAMYFIVDILREAAAVGMSAYVLYVPLLVICVIGMVRVREAQARVADMRVAATTELLQGVRIIKFFSWERPYVARVRAIRKKEVGLLRQFGLIISVLYTLIGSSTVVVQMGAYAAVCFLPASTSGLSEMDPIPIFTSMTYFNMLVMPLAMMPMSFVMTAESLISFGRIQVFLDAEELGEEEKQRTRGGTEDGGEEQEQGEFGGEEDVNLSEKNVIISDVEMAGNAIVLKHASFRWEVMKKKEGEDEEEEKAEETDGENDICIELEDQNEDGWDDDASSATHGYGKVTDLTAEIPVGSLTMIIGEVGSGKSSLLYALLGEMRQTGGQARMDGSIAFCAQTPWMQNATLLENVTFGLPMDETRFNEVVERCSLGPDIAMLQGGVNIEIGEKGVNVSGGQKYRVSLARACYRKDVCDIFFLDDPLGAVDAHVGHDIFQRCVCEYLGDKTRVMVTHQLQYLHHADRIIMMEDGRIREFGSYDELMSMEDGLTRELVNEFVHENAAESDGDDEWSSSTGVDEKKSATATAAVVAVIDKKVGWMEEEEDADEDLSDVGDLDGRLMEDEEKAEGVLSLIILQEWFAAMAGGSGCCCCILPFVMLLLLAIVAQVFVTGSSWWLTEWTGGTFAEKYGNEVITTYFSAANFSSNVSGMGFDLMMTPPPAYYVPGEQNCSDVIPYFLQHPMATFPVLCVPVEIAIPISWDPSYANETRIEEGLTNTHSVIIFAVIGVLGVIGSFFRSAFIMNSGVTASQTLHDDALERIARAPSAFFDTTPIGRILARFTTDTMLADFQLPMIVGQFFSMFFAVVGQLCLVGYTTDGFFVPVLIVSFILFLAVYLIYRKSVVEWKRLEAVSRSPIVAQLSETLNGIPTIRAYGREDDFARQSSRHIDMNTRALSLVYAGQRWVGSTVAWVSAIILVCVTSICILLAYYAWDIDLSYLALAVSSALSCSQFFGQLVDQATETEAMFNSVERLDHFAKDIPTEDDVHRDRVLKGAELVVPPETWPEQGVLTFENYSMRYRPGLPLVLKNVSFSIRAGEKVGIVGRTGSGKSSCMLAIFRFLHPSGGRILIDGRDISLMPLDSLRGGLSIIPQDPVLFHGTVRSNLDPFGDHNDEDIWIALEKSFIKEKIAEFPERLDAPVSERGTNFSVGERQLLCLARALLKGARILFLDEVTASVDMQTDELIQKTIRERFVGATVVTIAHRLNTIIDYDRVLVMENGEVAEFDTPRNLLSSSTSTGGGLFASLVNETGEANAAFLYDVALGRREFVVGEDVVGLLLEEQQQQSEQTTKTEIAKYRESVIL